mmetsp:Transcript_43548/g.80574  ORF Transcript_43548/g.80574 Transcript_43548/m.80574 type:complete len:193 (+) Transcript_43548:35-613(+)
MFRRSSIMRSPISIECEDDGTMIRISSQLGKKRPGMFAGGWKTRFCTLKGVTFTWAESSASEAVLGSLDVRGGVVDGPCLRQGGSDLDSNPKLCTFTVTPYASGGRNMDLRAETLSDARRWVMALQAAAKGPPPEGEEKSCSWRSRSAASAAAAESDIKVRHTTVDTAVPPDVLGAAAAAAAAGGSVSNFDM